MDVKKLRDTYNKIAEDYTKDHAKDTWDDDFIDYFSKELFSGARILDLGCGPGIDAVKLAKKGLKVYGLDLSEELLKIASKQLPEGAFTQGDMLERFPYEDDFFDGVFAKASLVHIPKDKIEQVLKETIRVLKKNGILHIAVKKGTGEREVQEDDYGYKYERLFSYWQPEEIKEIFNKYNFILLKEGGTIKPGTSSAWLRFLLRKSLKTN